MSRWKALLCALTLCTVVGCHRRPAPAPPPAPAPQAQPITPSSITVITPLPSVPATTEPNVQPAPAVVPPPKTTASRSKRHFHRNKKTKATDTTAPTSAAAAASSAGVSSTADEKHAADTGTSSVISSATPPASTDQQLSGQWSTGTAISSAQRTRLLDAIDTQEKRIPAVRNPTAPDTAAVLAQVKAFLAKAKDAVANNDLDGAQTLNMKAQVLLDELQQGS